MFDLTMLVLRLLIGVFFVLARFRWFYDPSRPDNPWFNKARHEHLRWKMCYCGYPKWFAPFVATAEVSAGLGVIVGLLTPLAAAGLLTITIVATLCTAKEKVCEQNPADKLDYVSCYLWRVEGLYIAIAALIVLNGGGRWSLDHLLGWF